MKLSEFKALNKAKGFHWFEPATLRFFKSRICAWESWRSDGFFISSERGPMAHNPRRYTVRKAHFDTGMVSSVSIFQEFATLSQAKAALKRLRKETNNE